MYSESNFSTIIWVVVTAQAIICGGLSAGLASAKNRDTAMWFFAGFLFGILGLIAVAGMPVMRSTRKIVGTDLDNVATIADGDMREQDSQRLNPVSYGDYKDKSCSKCGKQFSFFSEVKKRGNELYHEQCAH